MDDAMVLDATALPAELARVTRFVREGCGAASDTGAEKLDLIVEELFLNIAIHACPGGPVRIACSRAAPATAAFEFTYGGPPFDPAADAPEPDLDATLADRPIGGLGLLLVREMAESLAYRYEDGLNRLAVEVRLASKIPATD